MVQAPVVEQPVARLDGAGPRVGRAVHDPREARLNDRAAAHRARLERRVEHCARQPVVPDLQRGLAQGQHLGVRRWVDERDRRVVRLPDDHIVDHDHGTHRYLAGPESYPRLGERHAHEPFGVHLYARYMLASHAAGPAPGRTAARTTLILLWALGRRRLERHEKRYRLRHRLTDGSLPSL